MRLYDVNPVALPEGDVLPESIDFEDWVAGRGRSLLGLATALTGNRHDAEDLVQDVLSRALPRWDRIAAADDVDAYVRRMVVNAHTSWWRRFRRRESPAAEVRVDAVVDPPSYDDRVWQACRGLREPLRTAVVLRFYEDLDYASIAELTGVREGSVRSRVSRGLAELREQLGERDE